MRISDWSSDVCSSDLPADLLARHLNASLCLALAQFSCGRLRDFKLTVAGIEQHPDADQVSVRAELQLLNAYHAMRTDDPLSERRAIAAAQAHPPPPDTRAGLMQNGNAAVRESGCQTV